MSKLGFSEADLEAKGGLWTAREIEQQPQMLLLTHALLADGEAQLRAFIDPLLAHGNLRIILTGAGTSAFIGECLAPTLANRLQRRTEAIPTTDLSAAPRCYLEEHAPTLLVSFARSGDSPESVAAFELAERLVRRCWHLVITCNENGELCRRARGAANAHIVLLPEQTHDKAFAMTSSFSCMLYAGLGAIAGIASLNDRIERIVAAVDGVLREYTLMMRTLASEQFERIVYLGSPAFKGLAREAALKLLELTDGATISVFDSPLGFRHGPKAIVNGNTLIIVFVSNDSHTRRYDIDLIEELRAEGNAGRVLPIVAKPCAAFQQEQHVRIAGLEDAADVELLFPYIVAPQVLALQRSLALGKTPDRPNASGAVNRVVRGVRIHALY